MTIQDIGCEDREIGVSWSRLREHMECKRKAQLKAEGKKAKYADIRNFFPGTVVDICMRRWLSQAEPPPGGMLAMLAAVLDEAEVEAQETGDGFVRWRSPEDKAGVLETCRELLGRLEPILFELVIPHSYWPAHRFRLPLVLPYLDGSPQRVWLKGEMDLKISLAPASFRVYDLKNTKNTDYWRKTSGQLVFYELACFLEHRVWPEESGLIQPLCPEPVLRFRFTEQHRNELAAAVSRYCSDVWRKEFPLRADPAGCERCEVRGFCPRFRVPGGRGQTEWPAA